MILLFMLLFLLLFFFVMFMLFLFVYPSGSKRRYWCSWSGRTRRRFGMNSRYYKTTDDTFTMPTYAALYRADLASLDVLVTRDHLDLLYVSCSKFVESR